MPWHGHPGSMAGMLSLLRLIALLSASLCLAAEEWQPLFPDGAPLGAKPPVVEEALKPRGEYPDAGIRHVTVPGYKVMLPDEDKRTGAGVVIFPGGGYSMLAMGHEGYDYANWLVERGVVAMVVKYRVSTNGESKFQFPVPLLDARCAIRTMRARAKEWGVDPSKVGVMGSSAGGHLTSMTATLHKEQFEQEETHMKYSCRPDFAVLVYPVIAMNQSWGHMGSRLRLIGREPADNLVQRVSTQLRVDKDTPPCFLIHAADDKVVPVRNSLEFAARCAENQVPVVCHVFTKGGHGFGLGKGGDSGNWTQLLEQWMHDRQLIEKP